MSTIETTVEDLRSLPKDPIAAAAVSTRGGDYFTERNRII